MRGIKFVVLLVLVVGTFQSCAVKKSVNSVLSIKHGTSFGMCNGYCYNEYTYTEKSGVKYSKGWGRTDLTNFPDKYDTTDFSSMDWERIISKLDTIKFYSLPERIGCPDCADGGAEWIEISTNNKVDKVTFEFGKDVSEITELLKDLRSLQKE